MAPLGGTEIFQFMDNITSPFSTTVHDITVQFLGSTLKRDSLGTVKHSNVQRYSKNDLLVQKVSLNSSHLGFIPTVCTAP